MTQGRGLTLRCSQLDGKKDSQISRRYIALILSPGWFFFLNADSFIPAQDSDLVIEKLGLSVSIFSYTHSVLLTAHNPGL